MPEVTCSACSAMFDVDFAPGTAFVCGSCGATVTVPEKPVIAPRRAAPAQGPQPKPVAPRAASAPSRPLNAPRPPQPSRVKARSVPATAQKKSPTPILIAAGVGVLAVVALIIALSSKTSDDPQGPDGGGGNSSTPATPEDPVAAAYQRAQAGGASEWKAYADLVYSKFQSTSSQDPKQKEYERQYLLASRRVLQYEPDNALAHQRVGDVLVDLSEAQRLWQDETLDDRLRDSLSLFIEDAEKAHPKAKSDPRLWLKADSPLAKEWLDLKSQVGQTRETASARESDPFFEQATRFGERLAAELPTERVSFLAEGVTGNPFTVVVRKPYVFVIQRTSSGQEEKTANEWNEILQALLVTFYRECGESLGVQPMTRPTPVVVLKDAAAYTQYNRRADGLTATVVTSAGHFEPWANRLVCYRSGGDGQQELTTLFHEGTHQIIDWAMTQFAGAAKVTAGIRQSLWFSEGIADYFGGFGVSYEGRNPVYHPGRVNMERVKTLVDAKERGDLFPLRELLAYARQDYIRDKENPRLERRVHNAYAQGWGLCYLLQNWQGDKYRARWPSYLKAEFSGKSGLSAFEGVYGSDVDTIQKDFLEMIDALAKADAEGRIRNGEVVK